MHTRFFKKNYPQYAPVNHLSIALFRLGEYCQNNCLMCVNNKKPDSWNLSKEDLFNRLDFINNQGISRIVITGGEPTIHPEFWELIQKVNLLNMKWDLNTNGRKFQNSDFAREAVSSGLRRTIISFHSHLEEDMEYISRALGSFHETVQGIQNLLKENIPVILNCVINKKNINHLKNYIEYCLKTFGNKVAVKFTFPEREGRGESWEGIRIKYKDAAPELKKVLVFSLKNKIRTYFESIPNCILGDKTVFNFGRSGFGETHYLDDNGGQNLQSMLYLDSLKSHFAEFCFSCSALPLCCGMNPDYLYRYGIDEFVPL